MESSFGERGFRPLELQSASPGSVSVVQNLQRAAGPTEGCGMRICILTALPGTVCIAAGLKVSPGQVSELPSGGEGSCGLEEPGPTLQNSHLI